MDSEKNRERNQNKKRPFVIENRVKRERLEKEQIEYYEYEYSE
jgi:hypothetical protein